MINLVVFISGVIFSLGLVISQMINPHKVIGFLNIFGQWDASLAFVMMGAVLFNLITFRLILKRGRTISNKKIEISSLDKIDLPLVLGSIFFGVGWGILGVCPGPAIVNIVNFDPVLLIFILVMLVSMWITDFFINIEGKSSRSDSRM